MDGDGTNDTFCINTYPTFSEQIHDYCGRTEFVINEKTYHISDMRHGHYERVCFTDIDPGDNFTDIVLIGTYKGKWAEIYRYDGNKIIEMASNEGANYFGAFDEFWTASEAGKDPDPLVSMEVGITKTGIPGFSLFSNDEKHSFVKDTDTRYIRTDEEIYYDLTIYFHPCISYLDLALLTKQGVQDVPYPRLKQTILSPYAVPKLYYIKIFKILPNNDFEFMRIYTN